MQGVWSGCSIRSENRVHSCLRVALFQVPCIRIAVLHSLATGSSVCSLVEIGIVEYWDTNLVNVEEED